MFPTLLRRHAQKLTLLLFALLSFGVHSARASHYLGGEMSYEYLDANGPAANPYRYRIVTTLYINGLSSTPGSNVSPPPNNINIGLFNRTTGAKIVLTSANFTTPGYGVPYVSKGLLSGEIQIDQNANNGNGVPSALINPSAHSVCTISGPSQPFFLQKFTAIVSLPLAFDGYYAVCSISARNYTLTNLNSRLNNSQPLTLYLSMATPLLTIPNHAAGVFGYRRGHHLHQRHHHHAQQRF